MSSVEKDGNYKSKGTRLTNGSATVVYTCPASLAALVTMVNVAPSSGAAGAATLEWVDSSASATYCIVKDKVIPANYVLQWFPEPLVLDAGDTLKVTGANGYDVVVTVMETGRRNQ